MPPPDRRRGARPVARARQARREKTTEAYDDERPEPDDERPEPDEERPELSPADVARAASDYITALTGKELSGVVSLERAEDGWLIGVEVVEDSRIPSSNDVLGLYRAELDVDGSLVTYARSRRYPRGRGDTNDVS